MILLHGDSIRLYKFNGLRGKTAVLASVFLAAYERRVATGEPDLRIPATNVDIQQTLIQLGLNCGEKEPTRILAPLKEGFLDVYWRRRQALPSLYSLDVTKLRSHIISVSLYPTKFTPQFAPLGHNLCREEYRDLSKDRSEVIIPEEYETESRIPQIISLNERGMTEEKLRQVPRGGSIDPAVIAEFLTLYQQHPEAFRPGRLTAFVASLAPVAPQTSESASQPREEPRESTTAPEVVETPTQPQPPVETPPRKTYADFELPSSDLIFKTPALKNQDAYMEHLRTLESPASRELIRAGYVRFYEPFAVGLAFKKSWRSGPEADDAVVRYRAAVETVLRNNTRGRGKKGRAPLWEDAMALHRTRPMLWMTPGTQQASYLVRLMSREDDRELQELSLAFKKAFGDSLQDKECLEPYSGSMLYLLQRLRGNHLDLGSEKTTITMLAAPFTQWVSSLAHGKYQGLNIDQHLAPRLYRRKGSEAATIKPLWEIVWNILLKHRNPSISGDTTGVERALERTRKFLLDEVERQRIAERKGLPESGPAGKAVFLLNREDAKAKGLSDDDLEFYERVHGTDAQGVPTEDWLDDGKRKEFDAYNAFENEICRLGSTSKTLFITKDMADSRHVSIRRVKAARALHSLWERFRTAAGAAMTPESAQKAAQRLLAAVDRLGVSALTDDKFDGSKTSNRIGLRYLFFKLKDSEGRVFCPADLIIEEALKAA